jgi:uncharacterized protein (DUF433 family)
MLDWNQCPSVEHNPEKVSGAWVFKNTRVPVKTLFENIEGGATIDEFLSWFSGVSRDQVITILEFVEQSLIPFEKVTPDLSGYLKGLLEIKGDIIQPPTAYWDADQ